MRKILLSLLLGIISIESYASPSLLGDEGYISTPSSEVINDRNINVGISYLPGARSYVFTGKPNLIYSMSLGFIPRTELSINFNQVFGWTTPDNPYLTSSAVDRIVNAKFQILYETDILPSIAIGGRDIASNAAINSSNDNRPLFNNSFQQMFYLAIGKKFFDFKLNLGYSYAPSLPIGFDNQYKEQNKISINQSFRPSGFFIATETPKFFNIISGILEYDSKYFNYGINLDYNGLQAKLVMIDFINFNTRLSWSQRL